MPVHMGQRRALSFNHDKALDTYCAVVKGCTYGGTCVGTLTGVAVGGFGDPDFWEATEWSPSGSIAGAALGFPLGMITGFVGSAFNPTVLGIAALVGVFAA